MSPNIGKHSAGVRVNRTEQSAERVVKTDNKNRRTDRLQVLRYKTHPKFLAGADDKNGDEQDDKIAFQPEETSQPA